MRGKGPGRGAVSGHGLPYTSAPVTTFLHSVDSFDIPQIAMKLLTKRDKKKGGNGGGGCIKFCISLCKSRAQEHLTKLDTHFSLVRFRLTSRDTGENDTVHEDNFLLFASSDNL